MQKKNNRLSGWNRKIGEFNEGGYEWIWMRGHLTGKT